MKKHLVFSAMLLIQAAAVFVFAQQKPQSGDKISGVVFEDDGPMMMVNVTERDSADNIVAHTITDIDGHFSFRLSDVEYALTHPVSITVPSGLPMVDIIYDGDVACAVTPDKAVSFWTWGAWPEKMPEGAWKKEYLLFYIN
jgi:hypothetical protein